jgi:hypothetical protein
MLHGEWCRPEPIAWVVDRRVDPPLTGGAWRVAVDLPGRTMYAHRGGRAVRYQLGRDDVWREAVAVVQERAGARVARWQRDVDAIAACHARMARNPVLDFLWRRPWRAQWRPDWRNPREVWAWLYAAHDCLDGSVMCSCHGGFRFPAAPEEE